MSKLATNISKKKKDNSQELTKDQEDSERRKTISISLKYLVGGSHNLAYLHKYAKKHSEEHIFDDLETFIYNAENFAEFQKLVKRFCSHKSNSISVNKNNPFVKKLIASFETRFPECKNQGIRKDLPTENNIVHLHLKAGGKGKAVIFGFPYDTTFYILAFDPDHTFSG